MTHQVHPTPFHAVSLFSNCGAGDFGFRRAGFHFDVMAELQEKRLAVALRNHPGAVGVAGDLRKTWPDVVAKYRQRTRARPALLAACPPCQGLSSAQSRRGRHQDADAGSSDERNLLVTTIERVTRKLKPAFVVVENVPAFLSRKVRHPRTGASVTAAGLLVASLKTHYAVFPLLADLADYGVPQSRRRAFLTFVRRDLPILRQLQAHRRVPYPATTHGTPGRPRVSMKRALVDARLVPLDASRAELASDPRDPFHTVPTWEARRYQMVSAIPVNSGRSAWENDVCTQCGIVEADEEDVACPRCGSPLRRPVVDDGNGARLINGFRDSSYRRMHPGRPAATITTGSGFVGCDRTIHPWENRVLSVRECALLQTIPRSFDWADALAGWGSTRVRAMIGEAVPPRFTERHGKVLIDLLSGKKRARLMSVEDERGQAQT